LIRFDASFIITRLLIRLINRLLGLPTYRGKLVYMHSVETNEFWSALLEKAYAKLHGSYEALDGGRTSEALQDFTGGITEMFELKEAPSNLFQIIEKGFLRKAMMGCFVENDQSLNEVEAETAQGLIRGHAYSITKASMVDIITPRVSGKIPLEKSLGRRCGMEWPVE
jgi:calpain, invertebrate